MTPCRKCYPMLLFGITSISVFMGSLLTIVELQIKGLISIGDLKFGNNELAPGVILGN